MTKYETGFVSTSCLKMRIITSANTLKTLILLLLIVLSTPRDDDSNNLPTIQKLSIRSLMDKWSKEESGPLSIDRRKMPTTDGNVRKEVWRTDKDDLAERREMKKRKRSNRMELRRKRSAMRNRNEMNYKDRRESRRAGQMNNRHMTLSPTKVQASSKSPATTNREEGKKKKKNTFTRPPSAFGNAPPGSSAFKTFNSNSFALLFCSLILLPTLS